MDWFEPLDQYCERLGPGFWAEPLNAVTNLSFIIAAAALYLQWQRTPNRPITGLLLILNVFAVGIGSFLFHTFANQWSELADILPITIFINLYLLLAIRTFLGASWLMAAAATAAFIVLSPRLAPYLEPVIGFSAFYVPALLAIFGVGFVAHRGNAGTARALYAAGVVFALSIAFRTVDLAVCQYIPTGTHLVWHILNGVVLYLLVRLYLEVNAARATH